VPSVTIDTETNGTIPVLLTSRVALTLTGQ